MSLLNDFSSHVFLKDRGETLAEEEDRTLVNLELVQLQPRTRPIFGWLAYGGTCGGRLEATGQLADFRLTIDAMHKRQ